MKKILLVLMLTFSVCFLRAQVTVVFKAVNTSSPYVDPSLSSVVVMQHGTLIDSLENSFIEEWIVTLPASGKYEIIYETIFRTRRSMNLNIQHSGDTISLKVGELDYEKESYKPLIDKLKPGQKITISFRNEGCWMMMHQNLQIQRKQRGYFAAWDDTLVQLSALQVESIGRFEMELQHFKMVKGCTTKNYYTLTGPHVKKADADYLDGGCDWFGFYTLMKNLGAPEDWWEDKNEWN
jgi:hypothetical protein